MSVSYIFISATQPLQEKQNKYINAVNSLPESRSEMREFQPCKAMFRLAGNRNLHSK